MALGVIVVGAAVGIVGLAFVQGSWWHPLATDLALDEPARGKVAAVRERVALAGSAPQALVWLDLALARDSHPSDVRAYLSAARDELVAADDDRLVVSIRELDVLIDSIRHPTMDATAPSPYPVSTVQSIPPAGP
jgi:hypothetical protein